MKKLINDVQDVLDEQLAGLAKAHPSLTLHQDPVYVTRADAPLGKVALLSELAAADTRADALWLYRSGDAFGLSGRNFHHRRPIKSLNAPCKLMAAKVYC